MPVVLILLSGSALDVTWADEHIPAILQGWYPGAQGGRAIASILFGEKAPEGKLPVTFYKTTEELPDIRDYNMKGRTYRYMENEALYPFGYGLSYSDFDISNITCNSKEIQLDKPVELSLDIANKGNYAAGESIQLYIKCSKENTPNPQLKYLKKIFLEPGESKKIDINLDAKVFGLYNERGEFVLNKGEYELFIGTSQPDQRSISLTGKKPYSIKMTSSSEDTIIE